MTPTPERKPKHGTLEYWGKILKDVGLYADSIEHLVLDRSDKREIIRKRTRHIEELEGEQAKCHGNQRSRMSKSQKNDEQQRSLACQWTDCGKTFPSITGRKVHEKVHRKKESSKQSVSGAIRQ